MASPRDLYDAGAPAWRLPSAAGAADEVLTAGAGGVAVWATATGTTTITVVPWNLPFVAWSAVDATGPINVVGPPVAQMSQVMALSYITEATSSPTGVLTKTTIAMERQQYTFGVLTAAPVTFGAITATLPGPGPYYMAGALTVLNVGGTTVAWRMQAFGLMLRIRADAASNTNTGLAWTFNAPSVTSIQWVPAPLAAGATEFLARRQACAVQLTAAACRAADVSAAAEPPGEPAPADPALEEPPTSDPAEPALEESPPPAPTDDAPDDWDLSELGTPRASPEPQ